MMTFDEFHNGLRVLASTDRVELVNIGVMSSGNTEAWLSFSVDPFRWFICADDDRAMKLFEIIKRRTPAAK